ncbi:hypothetical protein BST83_12655 [Polaribacter filamentus]|jgi:uncharacterized membrane protein|uniref:Methylamine utilisation protein MauE domain-containing protein n=1 Tax=Polaribacter filamentus TaxID=53483 RepID=A0A2S7KZ06_9FLAO|nr:MauE/DoxX family redox-associated membrane protein [Polaribacter filamentus]PQB07904.1 hypothetical protein BST83_12655 [Polaribacter filamentus]
MDVSMLILKIIFGAFFCYAGFMHFKKPKFFNKFIPNFLPKRMVNYVFGAIEFLLGISLFFDQTFKNAALGIFILMTLFLPIHIWDLLKEKPAIGSKKLAIIRIPIQFLLMYLSYLMYLN